MSTNWKGEDYPHEGFVQKALERYFSSQNYCFLRENHTDLVCVKEESQEKWVIEAKGKTTSVGLDFRTGLGQLVQGMQEQRVNYALAMPDIPQFVTQIKKLAPWLRRTLNLYLIFVDEAGRLRFAALEDTL